MNVFNTTIHDLRQGQGWTFSFPQEEKKNEAQLIGGSKVRLKECRQSGMFLCASQEKTIVERELADLGGMAACRNQISDRVEFREGSLG